jgi:hypothetical protein
MSTVILYFMAYKPLIPMTYETVTEIYTTYDIIFRRLQKSLGEVDSDNLTITLTIGLRNPKKRNKLRKVAIHEFLHAHYYIKCRGEVGDNENLIERETDYYIEHEPDLVDLVLSFIENE